MLLKKMITPCQSFIYFAVCQIGKLSSCQNRAHFTILYYFKRWSQSDKVRQYGNCMHNRIFQFLLENKLNYMFSWGLFHHNETTSLVICTFHRLKWKWNEKCLFPTTKNKSRLTIHLFYEYKLVKYYWKQLITHNGLKMM